MIDHTQMVLVGVIANRKADIKHPTQRPCDGCGCEVFVTREYIPYAKRQAFSAGQRLYFACPTCAAPSLDRIATEGGVVECGGEMALQDFENALSARRRFLEGQN